MDIRRRKTLGSVAACIFCGVPGLAHADQSTEMVVSYADLDLNTHAGVASMYARLEAAANTVCTAHEGVSSRDRIRSCIDYSVRQAVAQIGAPLLVILYETRTGHVVLQARR